MENTGGTDTSHANEKQGFIGSDNIDINQQRQDFIGWLTKTNLLIYKQALIDEGYDDLETLTTIPADEIAELATGV
jgi:hypothetical protein